MVIAINYSVALIAKGLPAMTSSVVFEKILENIVRKFTKILSSICLTNILQNVRNENKNF